MKIDAGGSQGATLDLRKLDITMCTRCTWLSRLSVINVGTLMFCLSENRSPSNWGGEVRYTEGGQVHVIPHSAAMVVDLGKT